jgi:UDP-N-acetylmuramate dehydrogenase
VSIEVLNAPTLSGRTTLGLGGTCLAEVVVRAEPGLERLARVVDRQGGRPMVLGAGSNILAADRDLPLVLVRPEASDLAIERVEAEGGDRPLARVSGGLRLPVLLGRLAKAGCAGLEGLTGIPGTVGGAVAMNAGSFGVEIGERVARVRLWTPDRGPVWFGPEEMTFGYRSFAPAGLDEPWLVWEVELTLTDDEPDAVRRRMAETMARKKAAQPVWERTAGCVFKNPEGDSAGRLMDAAGLRGHRLGGMGFSGLHANFLVNHGHGRAEEAFELLDLARHRVRERFDVELQTEVKVIA